jgi:hypothetical protein
VIFGETKPRLMIVTTPNVEFNVRFESLPAGRMRHGDHRFEWTRAEFRVADAFAQRAAMVGKYVDAYRRYCWPVHSLGDVRLAPFHVLATEGAVHVDKDHVWHR